MREGCVKAIGMHVRLQLWATAVVALCVSVPALHAQDANQIVKQAVQTELESARNDHSHWRYLEHEDGGDLLVVVETQFGAISRHIEHNGQPASPELLADDDARIQRFIHDPSLQARQRANGAHDDKSAAELLQQMPTAFNWKVDRVDEENITLSYRPNPDYDPPDMESRVMGAMSGTMVVSRDSHRIRTFKGRLMQDVTIGFGLLARIKAGGTFDIERRPIASCIWQITETHVHISVHALLFKTIGQQQD